MRSVTLLFLLYLVNADPCPEGYTQAANGGDCYNVSISASRDYLHFSHLDRTHSISGQAVSTYYSVRNSQVKSFFDPADPYTKTSFNQAEMGCNHDSGGLLASIHSQEVRAWH